MTVVVAQRMWQRRDTAANWTSVNPTLNAGEIGFQIDPGQPIKMKVGNGTSPWVGLSEFNYLNVGAQQASTELTALASLSPATGFLKRTGAAAFVAASLIAADIPNLDAAKITSGTFDNARISAASVTQHQAALSINYSQLVGTPPPLLITKTSVVASQAAQLALVAQEGDVAVRTDLNKSYIHNGGVAGTMADWTELLTPTDSVLSFNGRTGAITLTSADVTAALTYTPLNAASYTAADVLSKLLTVDGSGSGLDADTVDGINASAFQLASGYTAADVLAKLLTVDGVGTGLDADLLDGQQGSYYLAASNLTGTLADARLSSNVPLKNAANTWTASQTINGDLTINDAAATARDINYETAGAIRWRLRVNSTDDFQALAYDDAGASLGTAFTITRLTRVLNFSVAPTFTDAATTRTNLGVRLDPYDSTARLSTAAITDYPSSYIVVGQADNTSGDFGLGTLMSAYVNSSRAFQFYGQALGGAGTVPVIKARSYHFGSGGWTNLYSLAFREAVNTFTVQQNFGGSPTAASVNSIAVAPTLQSTVTTGYSGVVTNFASVAAAFNTASVHHFLAQDWTPGVGHVITNHYGFRTGNLTAGGSNYAFHGGVASTAAGQWNCYMVGTAPNYFAGQARFGSPTDYGFTGAAAVLVGETVIFNPAGAAELRMAAYGSQANIYASRTNGTTGAPTKVLSTNGIGAWSARGHDGSAESGSRARVRFFAPADWSTISHPVEIAFDTTPIGSTTIATRWTIANDGTFTPTGSMNIGTSASRIGTIYGATGDFSGNVSSGQNFISAGGSVVLATTGAASVLFRPNGVASAVGEVSIASTGAVAIAGSAAVAGAFSGSAAFRLTGVLSPAQITASQNNYNPSDWTIVSRVRLNLSAAWSLTGWAAPVAGLSWHLLTLHNISGFNLTLVHQSASSVAANRFFCPNNANHVVRPNGSVTIEYDPTSAGWRVLAS